MIRPVPVDEGAGPESAASKQERHARPVAMNGNRLDSRDLFVGNREVIIIHGDEQYRLRLTAQNKLILTK